MSDVKIMELKNETKKDNQLQQLISAIKSGSPKARLPFWNYKDKLSISDDIIFKGEKLLSQENYNLKCYAISIVHT